MSEPTNNKTNAKKSVFAELSFVSASMILLFIAIIIACVIIYGIMIQSPKKKVVVVDDANVISASMEREITEKATKLSKSKNINVVVITTRDKGRGYTNSDEDCNQFAEDYYRRKVAGSYYQDNSGMCILIDLTLDRDGDRYMRMFTNGSAYYAIDDEECNSIFNRHKAQLKNEEYGESILDILDDVKSYDFSMAATFMNGLTIVIPVVLALLITKIATGKKKLDPIPPSSQYLTQRTNMQNQDRFVNQHVVVTHASSSSGGMGGGGGGGGGHSGGGGGRF